jgi:polyphosphate kinase
VYYFHNGGDEEVYCASADWMERNFFRRIELMFPIVDPGLKARVMADLDAYLADTAQAWELRNDGRYEQLRSAADRDSVPVQLKLLRQLAEAS